MMVFIDRVLKKLIVSMKVNNKVQSMKINLIKISPGWQGGGREGYKSAKGVVGSLSVGASINPGF